MRNNQVSIKIQRFCDEVPKNYPKDMQEIKVYADSNNLFEAITVAVAKAVEELKKYEELPSFGRVDSSTNENV